MRVMTEKEISQCNDVGLRIAEAMRRELTSQPMHTDQMHAAISIATTLVVSYGSMQTYLETLAACADAKAAAQAKEGDTPYSHTVASAGANRE